MNAESLKSQPHIKALEALVKALNSQKFVFVSAADSEKALQERIDKADQTSVEIGNKVLGFALQLAPGFVQTICEHAVSFSAAKVDDKELAELLAVMQASFPLSALAFSVTHGPRFVPIIDGSALSQSDLIKATEAFTAINLSLMPLANRMSLALLGHSVMKGDFSSATGSMIILAPSTERAERLREWTKALPLQNDTVLNQAKERLGSPLFWAKAAIGMVEHHPHQLRQEIVIIDLTKNVATSTTSPRMDFEFGFSLADITGRQ